MQKPAVTQLVIKNTMTGKKEKITSTKNHKLKLYVCGITPYDYAHLGHGRCNVTFDVLVRLCSFFNQPVDYCRNYTDIDDKLLNRSEKEFGSPYRYRDIADRFIAAFQEDMRLLNCNAPTIEPRVTGEIPEIIEAIGILLARGAAYIVDGDVYFSIDAFPDYGALSKRDINEMVSGARVAINEKKRNPLDFALWKSEIPKTFWQAPWGWGRPGWHIECSVMAYKYLGEVIDIHGGGLDLLFPHHENERAQSAALIGVDPVRIWMHNAFVQLKGEKMSKSTGNFFTLRDLFSQYDPMIIRYVLLMHHYRSPIDFSDELCAMAKTAYSKLIREFSSLEPIRPINITSPYIKKMIDFLSDDLNIVGMLGVIFELLKDNTCSPLERQQVAWLIRNVLGLTLAPLAHERTVVTTDTPATTLISSDIKDLLAERDAARAAKDWKKADELRDKLKMLGYEIQDKKLNK